MVHPDAYLATVNRLEPEIALVDRDAALASIAISLRRIADQLERRDQYEERKHQEWLARKGLSDLGGK